MVLTDYYPRLKKLTRRLESPALTPAQRDRITERYCELTMKMFWDVDMIGIEAIGPELVDQIVELCDIAIPNLTPGDYCNNVRSRRDALASMLESVRV